MKKYWLIYGGIAALFLLVYLAVEILRIPVLTDPSEFLKTPGLISAAFGISLLTADVLLPVPSSLVMVAHGVLFGIALGTLVSLIGNMSSFLFGYFLGAQGSPLLKRFLSKEELDDAHRLIKKWGLLALIVTRPLPIVAETTTIMAGSSGLSLPKSFLATLLGSLPAAFLYAAAGALAASFNTTALIFLSLIVLTGVFWIYSRPRSLSR